MNFRQNLRDGVFLKRVRFINLSGGISTQGPKIVIFSAQCGTLLFDSFGPGGNIRLNSSVGIFPKSPILNVSCLKQALFAGSGVKNGFNLYGCMVVCKNAPYPHECTCTSAFRYDA